MPVTTEIYDTDYIAKLVSTDLRVKLAQKMMEDIDAAIAEKRKELFAQVLPIAKDLVEKCVIERGFDRKMGTTELRVAVILRSNDANADH
jgi:hypothetical protein